MIREPFVYDADPFHECPICGDDMGSDAIWCQGQWLHPRCVVARQKTVITSPDPTLGAELDPEPPWGR